MFRTFLKSIVAVVVLCSADVFAADSNKPGYLLEMVTPYSVRVFKNSCDEKLYGGAANKAPDSCTKSPVTTGTMSVTCGEAVDVITAPLQGVFSLSSSRVGYLENLGGKTDILWEYEGARLTTTSNFTLEEKQQTIKMYLDKLAAEKLLTLQLGEHSDFDRSGAILFDKIRSSLPKYYRLKRSASQSAEVQEAPAVYNLVPTQSQLFYKYGDYTGVVELANIEFNDVPTPAVLKTNIINNVLPAFHNEDNNVTVTFKDSVLHVINKSDSPVTLEKVSLYYDGMFFDSILERPMKLVPAAASDISLASVIEKELKLDEKHSAMSAQEAWQKKVNFGFGVVYGKDQNSAPLLLGRVTTCWAHELAENPVETARLVAHMQALASVETVGKVDAPKAQYDFTIVFAFGKVAMKPEYLYKLDTVGQAMKKDLNIKGIIEGHSDNVGSRVVNQRISELRAHGAKQYLVKKYSIDPARIQTKGFGLTKAVADNGTPAGRAQNRRIEARFWGTND